MGRIKVIDKRKRSAMYGYIQHSQGINMRVRRTHTVYFRNIALKVGLPLNVIVDLAMSELIRAGWSVAFQSEYGKDGKDGDDQI